jgi:hypothetical protein
MYYNGPHNGTKITPLSSNNIDNIAINRRGSVGFEENHSYSNSFGIYYCSRTSGVSSNGGKAI